MLKDQIDSLAWWLTCVVAIAVKLRQEIAVSLQPAISSYSAQQGKWRE